MLVNHNVKTGINCLLSSKNIEGLPELFAYAVQKGINEIAFLRLKPVARGKINYDLNKTTHQQNKKLLPVIQRLAVKYRIAVKFDCSLMPMLCWHKPNIKKLQKQCVQGCNAGSYLISVTSSGFISGCGFLQPSSIPVWNLSEEWDTNSYFTKMRTRFTRLAEPCRSCSYLTICRGGCAAVSAYYNNDYDTPDPECPFVVEYNKKSKRRFLWF